MNDPTNSRYRYIRFKGGNNYRRFIKGDDNTEVEKTILLPHQFATPAHGTYGALLFDPRWRARREEILTRDLNRCVICKGNTGLQVHHRQYHFIIKNNEFKLPWEYEDRLLITLCEACHKRGHNKYKVPTINI